MILKVNDEQIYKYDSDILNRLHALCVVVS